MRIRNGMWCDDNEPKEFEGIWRDRSNRFCWCRSLRRSRVSQMMRKLCTSRLETSIPRLFQVVSPQKLVFRWWHFPSTTLKKCIIESSEHSILETQFDTMNGDHGCWQSVYQMWQRTGVYTCGVETHKANSVLEYVSKSSCMIAFEPPEEPRIWECYVMTTLVDCIVKSMLPVGSYVISLESAKDIARVGQKTNNIGQNEAPACYA